MVEREVPKPRLCSKCRRSTDWELSHGMVVCAECGWELGASATEAEMQPALDYRQSKKETISREIYALRFEEAALVLGGYRYPYDAICEVNRVGPKKLRGIRVFPFPLRLSVEIASSTRRSSESDRFHTTK